MNSMNSIKNLYKYLIVIIFVIFVIMLYYSIDEYYDNLNKLTRWSRNKCNYLMNDTLLNELNRNGIKESQSNWNLYFPCLYDDVSKEIDMMPVVNDAKYFILENCDEIVAKELLWKYVVSYFDYPIAKTMMPNGYILYDNNDLKRFANEYDPSKIYIMKKNIQRQEGLKITKDKNEILNGFNNGGYVLVQELLQNPYIISGRKTNMRFYVLVVCKGNNNMNVYVYKDGFMYYTKNMFKPGTVDTDTNITTGYIDRQVYIDNPLTHQDLKIYLDNPNRGNLTDVEKYLKIQGLKISEIYFNRIYYLLKQVFTAFAGKLLATKKFNDTNVRFQLFGVDIAVDNKLNPTIMEVNKGPDLSAKDERDAKLKHEVMNNIFKIIDVVPKTNYEDTMFLKILEITNQNKL